jgi:hypothetical protein
MLFSRPKTEFDQVKAAHIVEKAALESLLSDIGIIRFMSRITGGCFPNEDLAREVQNEYFQKADERPLIVHVAKAIFG